MTSLAYLREPYMPTVPPEWRMAAALERLRAEARRGVCDTGRYRMRFFDIGPTDSPALVFIHGLTDRPAAFAEVMVRLCGEFRCVAYEWPDGAGDGASLALYRHDDLAEDFFRLLDHLGLAEATPLGCSLGSTVAITALAADPERCPRGVLQGAFARRPLGWGERTLARVARYVPLSIGSIPLAKFIQKSLDFDVFRASPPEVWPFFQMVTASVRATATARRAGLLDEMDLRPLLPGIAQPVLMLGAREDRVIPISLQETVRDSLPNCRWVETEGCGHFPHYIGPEEMARAVREFMSR